MTMLIAVPLAAMCVCLFVCFLCWVALVFIGRQQHVLDRPIGFLFWFAFAGAGASGSFAAVVKLALVFSETP